MLARLTVIAVLALALGGAAPAGAGGLRQRVRVKAARLRGKQQAAAPRTRDVPRSGGPTTLGIRHVYPVAGPTAPPGVTPSTKADTKAARRPGRLRTLKRAAVVGGVALTLWAVLSTANPISRAVQDVFGGHPAPSAPTQVVPAPPADPPLPHPPVVYGSPR